MPNQANHMQQKDDEDLKFSGEQSFFDRNRLIYYVILTVFASSLFLFLHFREATVEVLELNKIAPGYIVSQVNFDFPDDEATLILRQEAVRDVGKIYQISPSNIRQRRVEFDNFLLYNQAWYEQVESGTFDQLYHATEVMEKVLMQLRLTDVQTLDKIKKEDQPSKDYFVYTPATVNEFVTLPSFVWESIQKQHFPDKTFSPLVRDLVIEFFKPKQWRIQEDIPSQRAVRKMINKCFRSRIDGK